MDELLKTIYQTLADLQAKKVYAKLVQKPEGVNVKLRLTVNGVRYRDNVWISQSASVEDTQRAIFLAAWDIAEEASRRFFR